MKRNATTPALAGLVAVGILVAACTSAAEARLEPSERTIYMVAVEPKGSTTVDKEPFPAAPLPSGGGYVLEEPDPSGTWVVETYRWMPSDITVVEGDEVTFEILGVNGASHPSRLEGYDLSFDVKRGQLTTVTFTADKPGVFRFICDAHGPSMTGNLTVLPAS